MFYTFERLPRLKNGRNQCSRNDFDATQFAALKFVRSVCVWQGFGALDTGRMLAPRATRKIAARTCRATAAAAAAMFCCVTLILCMYVCMYRKTVMRRGARRQAGACAPIPRRQTIQAGRLFVWVGDTKFLYIWWSTGWLMTSKYLLTN